VTTNRKWLDAKTVVNAARRGILSHGLDRDPDVASAIQSEPPPIPLLVECLDRPHTAYYLVPWTLTEGVAFVAEVDASSGALLGATTLRKPAPSFFLSPEDALNRAAQTQPRTELGKPRLVWRPCRESTHRTRPFYSIRTGDAILFVDMNGSVHAQLAPLGKGGELLPPEEDTRKKGAELL